MGGVADE